MRERDVEDELWRIRRDSEDSTNDLGFRIGKVEAKLENAEAQIERLFEIIADLDRVEFGAPRDL